MRTFSRFPTERRKKTEETSHERKLSRRTFSRALRLTLRIHTNRKSHFTDVDFETVISLSSRSSAADYATRVASHLILAEEEEEEEEEEARTKNLEHTLTSDSDGIGFAG